MKNNLPSFLFAKFLQGFFVIWGITTLLYLIFYVLENPINYMVAENANEATRQAIIQKYGLDKPLYLQYFHYLNGISPFGYRLDQTWGFKLPDLGKSYQSDLPVFDLIRSYWGGTTLLAVSALFFAAIIGVTMGVVAAVYKYSLYDKFIVTFSVLGISAPSFFVAVSMIAVFSVMLRHVTGLDATGYCFMPDTYTGEEVFSIKPLILPMCALAIRPLAVFIQLTRATMMDILQLDYIRTAHAKGISETKIIFIHALRNAMNPITTSIMGWFASLLAGAFFIEYIFNWRGIGKLSIDALSNRDFPVILGCTLFIGIIFVGMNILTDILYRWIDPRIR